MKNTTWDRVILLAHSQGTILSGVVLALLEELYPPAHARLAAQVVVSSERAVARKLVQRWNFEGSTREPENGDAESAASLPSFLWPGFGRRQPEQVTLEELRKLEIYCFANCASEMVPVKVRGENGIPAPWIESYGNEMDIVARFGVLSNTTGPGSVRIAGGCYVREAGWGHLLNAHYLFPMMEPRKSRRSGRRADSV